MRADWDHVHKLIEATKIQLHKAGVNDAEKVSVLEKSMAEERDALGRIEAYIGLPFGLKPCVKSFNLTDHDRK